MNWKLHTRHHNGEVPTFRHAATAGAINRPSARAKLLLHATMIFGVINTDTGTGRRS